MVLGLGTEYNEGCKRFIGYKEAKYINSKMYIIKRFISILCRIRYIARHAMYLNE